MKKKKKQGRKSKLTPELQAEIVVLLKHGNSVETICDIVGINKSTYYDWIKRGKKSNNPRNKYKIFQKAVAEAEAWCEARDVAMITKHSEENWRASAWRLSRKYPQKWGLKKYEDFDPDIGEVVDDDDDDDDTWPLTREDYAVAIKEANDLIASRKKKK